MGPDPVPELHRGVELIIRSIAQRTGRQHSKKHSLRQHVIVMRGRFAAWESLALDLDIMVEVHVNIKRVS